MLAIRLCELGPHIDILVSPPWLFLYVYHLSGTFRARAPPKTQSTPNTEQTPNKHRTLGPLDHWTLNPCCGRVCFLLCLYGVCTLVLLCVSVVCLCTFWWCVLFLLCFCGVCIGVSVFVLFIKASSGARTQDLMVHRPEC